VLTPGEPQVVFRYRPAGWSLALPLCGLGALFVLILALGPGRGERTGNRPPE